MGIAAPKTQKNDQSKAGKRASKMVTFGELSRFACYAVHTRFDAVQWIVSDAETLDDSGMASVIRQCQTFDEAMADFRNIAF